MDTLNFQIWLDYCFHLNRTLNLHVPELPEEPDGKTLANYFQTLFGSPNIHFADFSDIQIGAGLWFIFGSESSYWWDIRDEAVPKIEQIKAVAALEGFYSKFLDFRCDESGNRPAKNTSSFNKLDGVVYMLWDMDCLEGAAMNQDQDHLVDPIFSVLRHAIECKTVACQISGLHGLGHLQSYHPERVKSLVEPFVENKRGTLPWVEAYAKEAIKGSVM